MIYSKKLTANGLVGTLVSGHKALGSTDSGVLGNGPHSLCPWDSDTIKATGLLPTVAIATTRVRLEKDNRKR